MKTIITEIKSCADCPHIGHTGAFTKGGAKPCCDHPSVTIKTADCFKRVIPYKRVFDEDINIDYRVPKSIPKFCPL